MNKPQAPLIHTNGTSREALYEQYCTARHVVLDAIQALQAAAPNQRDYYPLEPAAWKRAVTEHTIRVQALRQVYAELVELVETIMDGG